MKLYKCSSNSCFNMYLSSFSFRQNNLTKLKRAVVWFNIFSRSSSLCFCATGTLNDSGFCDASNVQDGGIGAYKRQGYFLPRNIELDYF